MALFVLVVVGIVVAQTWLDWRDAKRDWVLPDWAKGAALAGVITVSLTAATVYTTVWLRSAGADRTSEMMSRPIWLELAFVLSTLGLLAYTAQKKRLRWMLLLEPVLIGAFLLGVALAS